MRTTILTLAALMTTMTAGCQLERLFPEEVGNGAARLTVKNAANIIALVDADASCGFAKPGIPQVIDGETGQLGAVTWIVDECELDFGWEPVVVGTDCAGEETRVSGKLTVSAQRTVEGMITGNPETPVIPQSPDAVTIALHAFALGYEIHGEKSLLMKQASIDVLARVPLAQSASLGVCSVSTSDVTIESITVSDAVYDVNRGGGSRFDVKVPSAQLSAQIGASAWDGVASENNVAGSITVWDKQIDIAGALDEEYQREKFLSSFSCKEDLKMPLEYACLPMRPRLAEGAAKLSINTVGNIVSAFAKDAGCGFESPAVKASAVVSGEVGRVGGTVTYHVESCALDFGSADAPFVGRTDCSGNAPTIFGSARFTGDLTVHGRLTGDPSELIIPTTRDAVDIAFSIQLEEAAVRGANPEYMEVTGAVSGAMHPRMAIDTVTGACSIDTPVVAFDDIAWSPGTRAVIRKAGNALGIAIDASSLDAQNGKKDGRENYLAGTITVDGEQFSIPLSGEPVLDPLYDPGAFIQSFACTDNMRIPESDDACSMREVVGDGVARLVIQTVGTLAGAVNADAVCGFSNKMDVLKNPTRVAGEPGQMGEMQWDIAGCRVGADTEATYDTDCTGASTYWKGHATMDSRRVVRGMRETIDVFLLGAVAQSIAPQSPRSVDVWLNEVALEEFSTWTDDPLGVLTIHSGTLEAFVQPQTNYAQDQQRYTIPTSIAMIQGVRLRNATATLVAQNKTFKIEIADTDLFAVNGELDEYENHILGSVTVDGAVIPVGGALDPDYDADALAASFACNVAPEVGACSQVSASDNALAVLTSLFALAFWRKRDRAGRAR